MKRTLVSLSRRNFSHVAFGALALAVSAPASRASAAEAPTLTLYNGQHIQTTTLATKRFTKETKVPVRIHSGDAPEIADQLMLEGEHSPADVYFTENSPELMLLDQHHLLSPVDPAALAVIPHRYSAPNGHWVGVLARQNVLAVNATMISATALPATMLALAEPAWKEKVAIAPGDADFFPLVGGLVALYGARKALAWLKGMRHNAQIFTDDEAVVAAVNRGAVATGIINNYYWARLRAEIGPAHIKCRLHHFGPGDIGNLVNVSGAAVLGSSRHPKEAQRFITYLVSRATQEMFGESDVDFEYPLRPGVAANPILKPFDELKPPAISITAIGNDRLAVELVRQAGLI